jgi:hypothetical protein
MKRLIILALWLLIIMPVSGCTSESKDTMDSRLHGNDSRTLL